MYVDLCMYACMQGHRKRGGGQGGRTTPFLGANIIHFLYKVLGKRSVQKKTVEK